MTLSLMARSRVCCWPALLAQFGTPALWASALHDSWLDRTAPLHRTDFAQLYRQVRDHTMCGYPRLKSLFDAVRYTNAQRIGGALVECGTARGGSAALMGLSAAMSGRPRTLWAFDTFDGLPPPTQEDPDFEVAVWFTGHCRGELQEVKEFFGRLGLTDRARLIQGLFADTLPATETGPIAVLHIDSDWYESVRLSLAHLYGRVTPGGVVQIDDYGRWTGTRRAVDEFLAEQQPTVRLQRVDYIARRWIKPACG
ncbi:MAG: hypothetical protein GEU73_12600 [Chloroflexi bacterium]|nr:hypothetical protein [Chloroflexota bacterium]